MTIRIVTSRRARWRARSWPLPAGQRSSAACGGMVKSSNKFDFRRAQLGAVDFVVCVQEQHWIWTGYSGTGEGQQGN